MRSGFQRCAEGGRCHQLFDKTQQLADDQKTGDRKDRGGDAVNLH